jgi:hypothetical protein
MIKIVPHDKEHIHDFTVLVILNSKTALEIHVDLGYKPFQIEACVNIPATGSLSPSNLKKFNEGINIAQQLVMGKLAIAGTNYKFKPISR